MSERQEAIDHLIKAARELEDVLDEEESGGSYTMSEADAFARRGEAARQGLSDALAALDAAVARQPEFAFDISYAVPPGNSAIVAIDADWPTSGIGGCRGVDPKYPGQKCGIPMKHTGTAHRFCARQPHDGYCVLECFQKSWAAVGQQEGSDSE